MNIQKKIIGVTVFLICMASWIAVPEYGIKAASAKMKLNKSSVTLYIGGNDSVRLKASGGKKIKWISKNPKVAVVDSFGKVTAKGRGKTVIFAKFGKKLAECKITVKYTKEIKLYKRLLNKTSVKVKETSFRQTILYPKRAGTLYAYQDLDQDKKKELIIYSVDEDHFYQGVYIFTIKKGKVRFVGSMPAGGFLQNPGYSKKSGLPYIYSHDHSYIGQFVQLYEIKNGRLVEKISFSVYSETPGKIEEFSVDSKTVSYAHFKKLFKKYLDLPLPYFNGEWNGGWDGFHSFDFYRVN